jgi:hypothetical protein
MKFTPLSEAWPPVYDPSAGRNGTGRVVIYHKDDGPAATHEIDAREACSKFPEIWSATPWPAA